MKSNQDDQSKPETGQTLAPVSLLGITVYALKACGHYGGGMAIVAAKDREAAKSLATGIDHQWGTRYHEPESVEELPLKYDGEPAVIAHYETGE